uniref:Uncharacterized protein n=1 Tax=Rhipicephalus zambeziensis TaxID=60191 RepID=A0A224YGA8_9ACAR
MATRKRGCLETTMTCCGAVVMELITRKNCTLKACTAHSRQQQKREHSNNKNKELRGNKTTAKEHLYICICIVYIYIYFFFSLRRNTRPPPSLFIALPYKAPPIFFAPFSQT